MKILLVDQYGEMGGAQRCLLEAAMGFAERGWELLAAAPEGPLLEALRPYCAEIHPLSCGPFASTRKTRTDALRLLRQLPGQVRAIRRIASRCHADVLYVNGPRVLPAAALASGGRPLLYHVHWMVPQRSAAALARFTLRARSASVILASRAGAAWLEGAVDPGRISIVYNGVDGTAPPERPRDSVRHIAVLGRIAPEKGQLEFVRAAALVKERTRGLHFTVSGAPLFEDAQAREYSARVSQEAARAGVALPGWSGDAASFLANVDLLVVPSDPSDHAPRVILEAFAAGVPVLACAVGAIPEMIRHGENGYLVPERTPETLARSILWAVARPESLRQAAVRARQLWGERYTLGRFQSEICEAVEAAVRRHSQRKPFHTAGANAPV